MSDGKLPTPGDPEFEDFVAYITEKQARYRRDGRTRDADELQADLDEMKEMEPKQDAGSNSKHITAAPKKAKPDAP